jgi:hypothetical protein
VQIIAVVALGDVVFLLGDNAAVGPVILGDLLAVLAGDLLQNFQAVVEIAGDVLVLVALGLVDPAVGGVIAVGGGFSFRIVELDQEVVGIVLVIAGAFAVLFADPVALAS